jgi:hypothetical protein
MSKNSFTPSFSIGKASSSLFPIKSYKNEKSFPKLPIPVFFKGWKSLKTFQKGKALWCFAHLVIIQDLKGANPSATWWLIATLKAYRLYQS